MFRPAKSLSFCLVYFLASLLIALCPAVGSGTPSFSFQPLAPSGQTTIFGTVTVKNHDLVILNGGLDRGIRIGSKIEVVAQNQVIAFLTVIDSRNHSSIALINQLVALRTISPGDIAKLSADSSSL